MDYKKQFIKCFNDFGAKHGRYQVFSDFITMGSASLHNAVRHCDDLEREYMRLVERYSKAELERFCQMLSFVVMGLEVKVCDFLGDIFMSLELGNARAGQFLLLGMSQK